MSSCFRIQTKIRCSYETYCGVWKRSLLCVGHCPEVHIPGSEAAQIMQTHTGSTSTLQSQEFTELPCNACSFWFANFLKSLEISPSFTTGANIPAYICLPEERQPATSATPWCWLLEHCHPWAWAGIATPKGNTHTHAAFTFQSLHLFPSLLITFVCHAVWWNSSLCFLKCYIHNMVYSKFIAISTGTLSHSHNANLIKSRKIGSYFDLRVCWRNSASQSASVGWKERSTFWGS